MRRFLPAAVMISALAGCSAEPPPPRRTPARDLQMPAYLREPVARAVELGHTLYVLDKVSAIATAELSRRVPDATARGVAGSIPVQERDGRGHLLDSFTVMFFTGDAPPRVAYQVRVPADGAPVLETYDPPREGTESFVRLVQARQTALAAISRGKQPIRPIVVPGGAIGTEGVVVYLLTETTRPDVLVTGKFYRVQIREDASPEVTVLSQEGAMHAPRAAWPLGTGEIHRDRESPVETDVLLSLKYGIPVYVETIRWMWRVDGTTVTFQGQKRPMRPM
jgi:hypothetical protein